MYRLDKTDSLFVKEFKLEHNERLYRHYNHLFKLLLTRIHLAIIRYKMKKERKK